MIKHLNNNKLPSNKTFGFFFATVFVILGGYFFSGFSKNLGYFFFILTIFFLIFSILKPDLLEPFNKWWMKLGYFLGLFITPVIIGSIYYFLFTPISLVIKLFNRDELKLNFKDDNSYWLAENDKIPKNNNFKNQF